MPKINFYRQFDISDCGPTCLQIISSYYGKVLNQDFLREKCNITNQGVSAMGICEGAESIGMKSIAVNVTFEQLQENVPLPCIAFWRNRHFVVVYKVAKNKVYVADPGHGKLVYSRQQFAESWLTENHDKGLLILLEPTKTFYELEGETSKKQSPVTFLLSYFRPYKNLIFQLAIGLLLTSLIQLMVPFLTQSMVDYGINHKNFSFINLILAGQLMLFFSRTFISIIHDWLLMNMSARINLTLLSDFLIKLMKLPLRTFESRNIGDFVQRIDDHKRVEAFLSSESLNVIFSIFSFVIFGIILGYYDLNIFLIYAAGTIFYILWVLRFTKKRAELDYISFDLSSRDRGQLIQLISGMKEIKINNSGKRRRWEWEEIQVGKHRTAMKNLVLLQYQRNGGLFISELKNILITFFAARAVIEGQITLGSMLAIQYIIGQLNNPIRFLISFVQLFQDARLSMERIKEVHDLKEEEEKADNEGGMPFLPSHKGIRVENLDFSYGGEQSPAVLKNINCEIPEGKVTAIVGTSGSGKTTLLKLLLKLYEVKKGNIKIGEMNLHSLNTTFWRGRCGVVMQDGFIFSDTIARNITESSSMGTIDKERLREAVRLANLEDFIENLPAGYKTKIGAGGLPLSGGENQRILIARAIYKNPDYLFFDEATSSLDANNERVIMEKLDHFYVNRTVIIIAHRLSTVKKADQIIVLEKGNIIEAGDHASLTEKRGAYYTLVKNQLELGN